MGKSIVIQVFTGVGRVFVGEVEQRCPQVQFFSLHGPMQMQVMGQVGVDPDVVLYVVITVDEFCRVTQVKIPPGVVDVPQDFPFGQCSSQGGFIVQPAQCIVGGAKLPRIDIE